MIPVTRRIFRLRNLALGLLAGVALVAASCTLVGQGDLHVANDLSGIGADNTILRAFAPDPGDPFPPPGYLNVLIRGDDFGLPPSYGQNGYVYLVRTNSACPESEGAPETFTLTDVAIVGIVTVTNGSVNQFVTMTDSPANRNSHFALIEIAEFSGYPGEHRIDRCGAITWSSTTSAAIDPCTLRTSLEGQTLVAGKSFALDANTMWQLCNGGAAAGSGEKFLFRTDNGGSSWALISRTTLGNPPPESGVGDLPNGNGVSALFFQDADKGWLGLTSAGHTFLRSADGGKDWSEVVVQDLDQGVPIQSINFTDAMTGEFTTPVGTWATTDGGTTWVKQP
jgi:hypothetical protein